MYGRLILDAFGSLRLGPKSRVDLKQRPTTHYTTSLKSSGSQQSRFPLSLPTSSKYIWPHWSCLGNVVTIFSEERDEHSPPQYSQAAVLTEVVEPCQYYNSLSPHKSKARGGYQVCIKCSKTTSSKSSVSLQTRQSSSQQTSPFSS
jgi:hypothetical protein